MDSSSTSVDIETINAYGSLIVEQSNNSEENSSTSSEETDKTVTVSFSHGTQLFLRVFTKEYCCY